jgi:hypothetical protein
MKLKKDLLKENSALVKQTNADKKLITKLTNEPKESVITETTYNAMKHEYDRQVEELKSDFHSAERELDSNFMASNAYTRGRTLLLGMPWYERMFLTKVTLAKILLLGEL